MSQKVIDFTIGADPELVITDNDGTVIKASDFVTGDDADFGYDGNGTTFEIRPGPSTNPLIVVNNIRDIFVRQTLEDSKFLNYKWISGSFHAGYPIGGHVHFGLKDKQIKHQTAISFLDNYVGSVSLLLENADDGRLRRKEGYGVMGDMRTQDWGFEYRPMSSWISSPYVANAILCLSKTVMYEAMNNSKFDWHTYVVADDFMEMRQERILEQFPKIWADIIKMKLYQVYKPYIDFIYLLITNKLTWFSTVGMKESWALVDMSPCIAGKVEIDLIWNRFNHEQLISQ